MAAGLVLSAVVLGSAAAAESVPAGAKTILSREGYWRWRVSWRKPVVMGGGEKAILPVGRVPFSQRPDIEDIEIAPPPADWIAADFDDTNWPREHLGSFAGGYFQVGGIRCRGRFNVTNPAAVSGLYLTANYRGGLVVYLNGREVARRDLPAGEVAGDVAADPYPDEAWVDAKGQMLPKTNAIAARIKQGDKSLVGRLEKRNRSLGPIELPTDALKKGVNVLAVAAFRSDYHRVGMGWFNQQNIHASWWPIRITDLELKAVGGGIEPNRDRRDGVHVWNLNLHRRIDVGYVPDAVEPLHAIHLVGARNGSYSGMLGVSSTKALSGVKAVASDLKSAGGAIPAASIDIRYAVRTDGTTRIGSTYPYYAFDGLVSEAPREIKPAKAGRSPARPGATQPILVRVNVPKDAAPGDYRGEVTVSAASLAQPVVVPLELTVHGWTVPDPLAFRTHAALYESPTSLSMQYKVKMWSEEHWKLVEQSLALMARVGVDLVNIPVVDRTQFGNDEGIVYWVKKGGGYDYDLTVLDRYLKLVKKHLGVPTYVGLQIWHAGGWKARTVDAENTVTVLDPATGKKTPMQVPVFGTPESVAFWKSALGAIRAKLAEYGMDKSACLGILSDSTAPDAVFQMFNTVAPDLGWMRGCHGQTSARKPYRIKGPATVVYNEHCYGMSIPDPAKRVPKIWDQGGVPSASYFRSDFDHLPPLGYRAIPERSLYHGKRGFGRMGFDYWLFPKPKGRGFYDLYNRWPRSTCAQRRPTLMKLAWHGPEGPVSTIRYELLCEGLQEAEAMIVIAEAANKSAAALGPDLTARCRQLLIDRINRARIQNNSYHPSARDYADRQADSTRIYATAAAVAAKLGT